MRNDKMNEYFSMVDQHEKELEEMRNKVIKEICLQNYIKPSKFKKSKEYYMLDTENEKDIENSLTKLKEIKIEISSR